MKKSLIYILAIGLISFLGACERVIDLDLPDGEALPYIDAWITDQPGVQTIKFLKAVNYMDTEEPSPITDAQIILTDVTAGQSYPFQYQNGAYRYDPGAGVSIGIVGHTYKLDITYNGQQFEGIDEMKRVPVIDSITYEFREEKEEDEKEGYYAKFYAKDLPGGTDFYWIRTYRNNGLNYYAGEMFSIDGAFNEDVSDGFDFIPPFREGITSGEKPYQPGDEVKVLLRSLSRSSYNFISLAIEQLNTGGLFAEVLQNVPANMQNTNNSSTLKIYGWFGTVAESSLAKTIQ